MQPIIRRTITITITETWTITWADGQETVWEETYEITQPASREPGESLAPDADAEGSADSLPAPAAGDSPVED